MDFSKECTVFILALSATKEKIAVRYDRPAQATDAALAKEAGLIFTDMRQKGERNIQELVAIYIARSQAQLDDFLRGAVIADGADD